MTCCLCCSGIGRALSPHVVCPSADYRNALTSNGGAEENGPREREKSSSSSGAFVWIGN
jgi:hypothetical protein